MTDSVQTASQQLISLVSADPENFVFKTFVSDVAGSTIEGILAYFHRDDTGFKHLPSFDPLRTIISSDSELTDFMFLLSQLKRKSALEFIVENELFGKNPRKQFQDFMKYLFTYELSCCLRRFLEFIEEFFQNQPFVKEIRQRYRNDESLLMQKVRQTALKLTVEEFFSGRELIRRVREEKEEEEEEEESD